MASGHEMNSNDIPDVPPSFTAISSCNDTSPLPEENFLDSSNSNRGLKTLFHKHHGNKPSVSQDLPSSYHHSLRTKSRNLSSLVQETQLVCNQSPVSLAYQQSGNEPIRPYCQPRQSISSIGETACLVSPDVLEPSGNEDAVPHVPSGTEFSASQNTHSFRQGGFYAQEPIEIDDSHPTTTQPSDTAPSVNRQLLSAEHNFSENRYGACSETQQPVGSETRETQGLHSLPQAFTQKSPSKRRLLRSHCQQEFKRESFSIKHAESRPSTSRAFRPSHGKSSGMGSRRDEKQDTRSDANKMEYVVDLNMLQHPYSDSGELRNIFVYGPLPWTSGLLQTFANGTPLNSSSPYSFAFQRNITRCGVLYTVSVWQIEDLIKSRNFLRTSCTSSKSTIIFVLKAMGTALFSSLRPMFDLVRREICEHVPISLVATKYSKSNKIKIYERFSNKLPDSVLRKSEVRTAGFCTKARFDLSAFFECSVDSIEEVEAVMFNALDVSNLLR